MEEANSNDYENKGVSLIFHGGAKSKNPVLFQVQDFFNGTEAERITYLR